MYQSSYAEQLVETPRECRDRERRAFDRAIELLEQAEEDRGSTSKSAHALQFICRLWEALIEDLAAPENDLPDMLKAKLVSIGIWVMREVESIRLGRSRNFRGLIEICSIVRDGLR
jgi:flagellar protein FlaF